MDKHSITGLILIAILMGLFVWISQPSEERIAAQRKYQDSIRQVELARQIAEAQQMQQPITGDSLSTIDIQTTPTAIDSMQNLRFDVFSSSAEGEEEFTQLENELLALTFSNKGGRISKAQLKKYQTSESLPVVLFDGEDETVYGFNLVTATNRIINTNELFFTPIVIDSLSITMRLSVSDDQYLDFVYSMQPDSYMLRFEIKAHNLADVLTHDFNYLDMNWNGKIRQQEKGRKFEERYTQLFYKFMADDVESLSETSDAMATPSGRIKWVAFKDQFFSSVFIADEEFSSAGLKSTVIPSGNYLKEYHCDMKVGFDPSGSKPTGMRCYLGPNHFATLQKYDEGVKDDRQRLELERLVPLGSSLFRWINRWLVIPMFNFFGSFISNYGVIILLMTIVVKLIIFPLTYKSYMSSAKMRVLRPQVEAISAKYPGQDKAMERQKATMDLYSRAGASPMSGCLPMLLQMPVLIALFMFFPAAIELRHQSFLWADDLSTYDAIFSWDAYIPLITPYFGNHISLFCLLMTAVNIVFTKFNAEMSNTGQQQMPGMKYIMYLMPVMLLIWFNEYASGLTYYYLISTLFSVLQTIAFRQVINEEKLLAKLEANKAKKRKPSGFMAKLADMQKKQQELARQQAKTNAKRRR
ncbi:MAG: membrane protein insertase YidC [Bacteroidales bacterium]|jgi:YidC/Oxa1 family membrane protein insertase|nr:membrane protein insertase YidC [Bacteroidales bacterium]